MPEDVSTDTCSISSNSNNSYSCPTSPLYAGASGRGDDDESSNSSFPCTTHSTRSHSGGASGFVSTVTTVKQLSAVSPSTSTGSRSRGLYRLSKVFDTSKGSKSNRADTYASLTYHTDILVRNGCHQDAAVVLQGALQDAEASLPPDHLTLVQIRARLAEALLLDGQYHAAQEHFQWCVSRSRHLGPVAATACLLGLSTCLHKLLQHSDAALACAQQAYANSRQLYGICTATMCAQLQLVRCLLAATPQQQQVPSMALPMAQQCVEYFQRHTIAGQWLSESLELLTTTHQRPCRHQQPAALSPNLSHHNKQRCGAQHRADLQSFSQRASTLMQLGAHAQAVSLCVSMLAAQKHALGESHPATIHTAAALAPLVAALNCGVPRQASVPASAVGRQVLEHALCAA